jgi:hypothetical protein
VEHFSLEMMDFFKDIEEPVVNFAGNLWIYLSASRWAGNLLLKTTRAYANAQIQAADEVAVYC